MEPPRHAFYFPRVIVYSTCTPPQKSFVQIQSLVSLVYHQLRSKTTTKKACCSLVATRTTTNYERQPRSTNLCGHERCCVHEVNFSASSYRYKYHLLTLPTPPAYQELNFLSKTSASIQHGRGVVVPVSKRSEKMSCGHRESSHLLPKTVQYLGMSSSSKRPQTTSKPSVSRWSCSSTYATDEKNVSSLLLPTSLTARS
jgi:hypothetical protein